MEGHYFTTDRELDGDAPLLNNQRFMELTLLVSANRQSDWSALALVHLRRLLRAYRPSPCHNDIKAITSDSTLGAIDY